MAIQTGTFGKKSYVSGYFSVYLEYEVVSQNVANNTSHIRFKPCVSIASGASLSLISKPFYIELEGGNNNTLVRVTMPAISGSGPKTVKASGWTDYTAIKHTSNGTKNLYIDATYYPQATINGTYYNTWNIATGNLTLPAIPQESILNSIGTIYSNSSTITVNVNKRNSSLYHRFRLYVGGTHYQTWDNTSGGSYTLALNSSTKNGILDKTPASTSVSTTMYLDSYTDSARTKKIGSTKSASGTAYVDSGQVPSITKFEFTRETPFMLSNSTSIYLIQKYGKLTYAQDWTIPRGTTFSSATTTYCGTVRSNSKNGSFITTLSGAPQFKTVVTDKRGRKTEKTTSYNVYPYSMPSISIASAQRSSGENESQDKAVVTVKTNICSIINSASSEMNRAKLSLYIRKSGTTSWGNDLGPSTYLTPKIKGYTINPSLSLDLTSSYDVMVTLRDEFNSVSATGKISTADKLMAIGKYGVGFGKLPEGNRMLDVGGDIWDQDGRNLSNIVSLMGDYSDGRFKKLPWSAATSIKNNTILQDYFPNTSGVCGYIALYLTGDYRLLIGMEYVGRPYGAQLELRYEGLFFRNKREQDGTWGAWKLLG